MSAELAWTVAGVSALIGLNALYVASEFALIGAQRSKLELLARTGRSNARRMLTLLSDEPALDRAIAAIQVGITLASLGLGMYGEYAVAELLRPAVARFGFVSTTAVHAVAAGLAVAGLVSLHVILGEIVPKSMALLNPSRAALWLYPVMEATRRALAPLVMALAGISRLVLRALRVRTAPETDKVLSAGEIEAVIEESCSGGILTARHAEILVKLLAFEDLQVRQAMVPRNRVCGLPADTTEDEALEVMRTARHSRYPVHGKDLDDILGYIHAKDVLKARGANQPFDLRELARPVLRIPETAQANRLLRLFRRRRAHMAVVLDEHGGTAGIVMPEDLVEEIFGEVQDEFDADEPTVCRLGPGLARASGEARIDEINEELGLALVEPHVDTIGGLIMARLGRLAAADDRVTVGRITLKVERVGGRAVRSVLIAWKAAGDE